MIFRFLVKRLVSIDPHVFLLAAVRDLGWGVMLDEKDEIVQGLVIGTDEWIEAHRGAEVD